MVDVRPGFDMDKLLVQEVEELTSLIREFGEWSEIRGVVQSGGHDPESDLLASFTESEEGEEWGVVVTKMRMVFEWFRNTDADPSTPVWRLIIQITYRLTQTAVSVAVWRNVL